MLMQPPPTHRLHQLWNFPYPCPVWEVEPLLLAQTPSTSVFFPPVLLQFPETEAQLSPGDSLSIRIPYKGTEFFPTSPAQGAGRGSLLPLPDAMTKSCSNPSSLAVDLF